MPHAQTHKYVEKDGDKVERAGREKTGCRARKTADGNEGRLRSCTGKAETASRIDEGICRCECNRKVFAEVGDEEKIFQGHQRDKDSLFDGKAHRAIWTICRNRDGVIGKTQYFQILEPHKGSGFDNVKVQ